MEGKQMKSINSDEALISEHNDSRVYQISTSRLSTYIAKCQKRCAKNKKLETTVAKKKRKKKVRNEAITLTLQLISTPGAYVY